MAVIGPPDRRLGDDAEQGVHVQPVAVGDAPGRQAQLHGGVAARVDLGQCANECPAEREVVVVATGGLGGQVPEEPPQVAGGRLVQHGERHRAERRPEGDDVRDGRAVRRRRGLARGVAGAALADDDLPGAERGEGPDDPAEARALPERTVGVAGGQPGRGPRGECDEPLTAGGRRRGERLGRTVGSGQVDDPIGRRARERRRRVGGDAHTDDRGRLVLEQLFEVELVDQLRGGGVGDGRDGDTGRRVQRRHEPAVAAGPPGDQPVEPGGEVAVPDQVGDVGGDVSLAAQGGGEHLGGEARVTGPPGRDLLPRLDQRLPGDGGGADVGAVRGEPQQQLRGAGCAG